MWIFDLKLMRLAAILAFVAAAGPAWAMLTVETSNAPGIEIDAEFSDDHVFDLPKGATVKLTKTSGQKTKGDTHTIKGPYRGTLDDYNRLECWRPGADCPSSVTPGGTKSMQPGEGGVRSTSPKN